MIFSLLYLPYAGVNVSTFTTRFQRFTKSCALPKVVKDKLMPMPSSVQGMHPVSNSGWAQCSLRPTLAFSRSPAAPVFFCLVHTEKSLGNWLLHCSSLLSGFHIQYLHVSLTFVHCDIASRFQPSQRSAFLPRTGSKQAISKKNTSIKTESWSF